MALIDEHVRRVKEHLDEIKDAIDDGVENKPITVGFHSSACSVELLELYLHKINKISVGKVIKHNWFKKPQIGQKQKALADRKIGVEFLGKETIYNIIYEIERNRSSLVYGRPGLNQINGVIDSFLKLKRLMLKKLKEEGVEIEKE